MQFFAQRGLIALKKGFNQFAFTTYNDFRESLEPSAARNGEEPQLVNRNMAALNTVQQVRP
jgi:hypothetical protein